MIRAATMQWGYRPLAGDEAMRWGHRPLAGEWGHLPLVGDGAK
jgi:pyruvate carboxylase